MINHYEMCNNFRHKFKEISMINLTKLTEMVAVQLNTTKELITAGCRSEK